MKEQIIQILESRAEKFKSVNHSFEEREIKSAIDTIKRLVPPELFAIHGVVWQSEQLCEQCLCKPVLKDELCKKCYDEIYI